MHLDQELEEVAVRLFHLLRETFRFVMQNLYDITLTTVAWLLLQLPIITGPAATVAVYHFARQALLQNDAQFRDFLQGLRRYFWRSWLIVVPELLLVLLLAYDVMFFLSREEPLNRLWASIPMAVFSFLLVLQNYVFVFFVRERGALWTSLKRATLLALTNPVYTFVVLLLTLLYLAGLYATRIGLALVFVGPVAVLQTKAVQQLLAAQGVEL
jgi:uncharacterized membrane protein YesL